MNVFHGCIVWPLPLNRFRRRGRKFLLAFLGALLLAAGAESASISDLLSQQTQIDTDINRLQKAVETELADIHLRSSEIAQRHEQILELERTLSDDMSQWGYTDPEKEQYTHALQEVDTLYAAYSSLTQIQGTSSDVEEETLKAFKVASMDIVASDALRRAITKASRELGLQFFQIQVRTSKLRLALQEAQRLRKRGQEAASGGTPLARPRLHALAFENAKLEVTLSWYQVQSLKKKYDQEVERIQRLQKRLDDVQDEIVFPQETLDAQIKQLQERINSLEREMNAALKNLDAANISVGQTRLSLGAAPVMPLTILSSRFLEQRGDLSYWANLVTVLEDQIRRLKEAQQIWRTRYRLFHDQVPGDEIWSSRDRARIRIQEMESQEDSARVMEADILRQIATLRLHLDGVSDDIRPHVTRSISRLQSVIPDIVNRQETMLSDMIFLQQRLYEEAGDKLSALRLAEKAGSFTRQTVMAFLETELWRGEGYSVTVSKLITAILVFLSSFFLSSLGSRWIKRWMVSRFKASDTAAGTTQRILFYILWLTIILIALNIVKIPLTAFAFMGGALALGIGFGMQNIFNNLISGFIVIFSRPFKVNDIISVAGMDGRVQEIGSRSTTLRTWDGLDVVLPNRYFLDNHVTNWTGSDVKKRDSLKVSVAYGSNTRRVEELMLQVAQEHPKVLENPAPRVRFKDFGESALEFSLYFWVELGQASASGVSSDMRHRLVQLFEEEGIVIPYPQQDLHLDAPLTQQLMKLLATLANGQAGAPRPSSRRRMMHWGQGCRRGGKFLLAFLGALLLAAGAESASVSDLLSQQTQIDTDITNLKKSVEAEIADIHLGSAEIAQRHEQIAELEKTLSDDMFEWGYTDPERDQYTQALQEVDTLYSTYSSLIQLQGVSADVEEETLEAFKAASVDIVASDALRKAILKASRELELQSFQIQSKTNKLRLDLQEAQKLRQRGQEAQSGGTPLARPRLHALAFENAKLEVTLSWYQVQSLKEKYDQEIQRIQRLQKRLDEVQGRVIFPQETLDARLKQIQDEIGDVEKEMEAALKNLDAANFSLARIRAALGSTPVIPLTVLSSSFLESRGNLNYWENLVTILEEETKRLKEAQQVWHTRYQLFHNQASGEEIWGYRDTATNKIEDLQRQMESARVMETDTLRQIAALRGHLENASDDIRPHITRAISRLQRVIPDIVNRQTTLCSDMIFLQQRLHDEASDKLSALRLAEKAASFSKETVMAFMNTELWNGDGYSVTVSKLITAILVFLSSFFLSSLGSHWIKRWMIRRFKARDTAANATQRIVFYVLWITFVLIALNIVKIPLTAFAFMGGAFAVGIGFGMQNIFNNLISGFIVIFSRPFKVNDIIAVAGTEGKVQDIGSRSTTVKTWDGLDVVLPNRYFLENSVTNWTGSDVRKRDVLRVGVGYEADSRRVEELLLKVAKDHSKVLKNPPPFVRFQDFGDNALMFDLFFWVDLSQANTYDVASDLRHHLQHLFKDEGINIPYPQQDLHLDVPLTQELMKLLGTLATKTPAPAEPEAPAEAPSEPAAPEADPAKPAS